MAAVVATLVYVPVGIALALLLRAFGISFENSLTLDAVLSPVFGLLAWWLIFFVGAFGYAAWLYPWGDKDFGWPGRR
ncbi:MAG: hypothetical protein ACREU5_05935 [Burkholderiales bacterium]